MVCVQAYTNYAPHVHWTGLCFERRLAEYLFLSNKLWNQYKLKYDTVCFTPCLQVYQMFFQSSGINHPYKQEKVATIFYTQT